MKIIGHKEQIEKLDSIASQNKIGNAYVFEGIRGIGKATIAKLFAEKIMGNSNYIYIVPDEGVIKVDMIRNLKEEIMLKPIDSDRKVAIIDDAECMNEQTQNALLKILEEPPVYATIILITSNKEKLLYTIKSRCINFKFNPLTREEVQDYFDEPVDTEWIEYCRGSIGAIIKLMEENCIEIIERFFKIFKEDSMVDVIKNLETIKSDIFFKDNIQDFLNYLLYMYSKDLKQGNLDATNAIDIIEEARLNLLRNANFDIALDRMAIKLWKWRRECKRLLV